MGWFTHKRQDKNGVVEVDNSEDEEEQEDEEMEDDEGYAIRFIFTDQSDNMNSLDLEGLTLAEAKKKLAAIQTALKSSDSLYILNEQKENDDYTYEITILNLLSMRNKCVALKIEHE